MCFKMCIRKFLGIEFQHSSEYPALTSALNLLDEVFDLQARSQWLRRGLINRLLGEFAEISQTRTILLLCVLFLGNKLTKMSYLTWYLSWIP